MCSLLYSRQWVSLSSLYMNIIPSQIVIERNNYRVDKNLLWLYFVACNSSNSKWIWKKSICISSYFFLLEKNLLVLASLMLTFHLYLFFKTLLNFIGFHNKASGRFIAQVEMFDLRLLLICMWISAQRDKSVRSTPIGAEMWDFGGVDTACFYSPYKLFF